jgi:hypothetical protein
VSKESKVLRTRKVKRSYWDSDTSSWNWFCSHQCQQDFWNKYGSQIRAIAPRLTPLETPVDVIKEEREGWNGETYTDTKIIPIDNATTTITDKKFKSLNGLNFFSCI